MTVLTVGSFDLTHVGHYKLFERCAKLGELTVAVNRDEFISSYKGKKPILTELERLRLVKMCPFVSKVMLNWSNDDLRPLVEQTKPDILAVGSDWAVKDYYTQTKLSEEWLEERHIVLVYLPYTKGLSASEIKERCLQS